MAQITLSGSVSSCARGTFQVETQVNGVLVSAQVPGLTIEIRGASRCMTFDLVEGIEAAEAAFTPGKQVTVTVETV